MKICHELPNSVKIKQIYLALHSKTSAGNMVADDIKLKHNVPAKCYQAVQIAEEV
jgi:hypothetical protein